MGIKPDFNIPSILEKIKQGDNSPLKSIYTHFFSPCTNKLIFDFDCNPEDAYDLYADAIINLRDKMVEGSLDDLSNLGGYLYTTCKNMYFSRQRKMKNVNLAINELLTNEDRLEIPDKVEEKEYINHLMHITKSALDQISENCKEMLISFYFHKMSIKEIKTKFNFASENVAKVSKSRCLSRLIQKVKLLQSTIKY